MRYQFFWLGFTLCLTAAYADSELKGMQFNLPDGFTFNKEGKIVTDVNDWTINQSGKNQYFVSNGKAGVRIGKPAEGRQNVTSLASNKKPLYVSLKGDKIESATMCAPELGWCITQTPDSCKKFRDGIGAKTDKELATKIASCNVAMMNIAFNKQDAMTKAALEALVDLNEKAKVQKEDLSKLKEFALDTPGASTGINALSIVGNLCLHIGSEERAAATGTPAPKNDHEQK